MLEEYQQIYPKLAYILNHLFSQERNMDDTKKLLHQLYNMKEEIERELSSSAETNADFLKQMEADVKLQSYVEIKNDHIKPMGDSIEEVNRNSKVDMTLFQGDMNLAKKQAEEIVNNLKDNESDCIRRQAYRDKSYPKTLWSSGVYYSFHSNATKAARRVFTKAAEARQNETCIKFFESNTAPDRIVVFKEDGCWSHLGRIGGLSLGSGCESDGWLSQFTKETKRKNYNYELIYDFGSVLWSVHYGATVVSRNKKPVMVPRGIKYLQTLGSDIISFYDKLMTNLHYKCLSEMLTYGSRFF
ncbi:unnamed protein product [Angiostrongylus costaricensis]|uniref:ZnMc domain-containing protein n=1 Tax=Angiostrongylus costaricensis TaxID=334426 RepID=A0A0R3PHT6_ANGCS|nr:unnamed protein product [Angiostrongylus costaricensis]